MLAGFDLLNAIPKTVWAAMVVSFIVNHETTEEPQAIKERIMHEWELLSNQGLVLQKPTAKARRAIVPFKSHQRMFV